MQLARPSRALLSGRGRALLASSAGPSEGTNGERRGRRTYRLELGTAHPVSNVRPLRIVDDVTGEVMDETLRDPGDAQLRWLVYQRDTTAWHHAFWLDNNARFLEERRAFEQKFGDGGPPAGAVDLLYSDFLERNRERHQAYNREWWRRNLGALPVAGTALVSRLFSR